MKVRLSSVLGVSGKSAIRALLVLDVMVGLLGLGIGMRSEAETGASPVDFWVAVQVAPEQELREAALGGSAPALHKVHLSAAEFAAALRAGEATFGTWDPERKAFVAEPSADRTAPI